MCKSVSFFMKEKSKSSKLIKIMWSESTPFESNSSCICFKIIDFPERLIPIKTFTSSFS